MNREDEAKLELLAEQLAEAIQNSAHDNINVFRVVSKIKDLGYDFALVAEFSLLFKKREDSAPAEVQPKVVGDDVVAGTFTEADAEKFSKAFHIKL